jgi:hypothetical protein
MGLCYDFEKRSIFALSAVLVVNLTGHHYTAQLS